MNHVAIIVVCECVAKGLWCIEIFSLVRGVEYVRSGMPSFLFNTNIYSY